MSAGEGLSVGVANVAGVELSDRERLVLELAELRGNKWTRAGTIRARLGVSEWVYAAELDALIDTEAAIAAEPALCRRLRALRDARRAVRSPSRALSG